MVKCCEVFSALCRLLSLTPTRLNLLSLYQGTVWLLKWHNESNISLDTIQSFQGLSTTGQWLQKSHLSFAEALFSISSTEKQRWVTGVQWTEGGCLTGSVHSHSSWLQTLLCYRVFRPKMRTQKLFRSLVSRITSSNVHCPLHCYITNVSS